MPNLKHLKVGDQVFVVHQMSRPKPGDQPKTEILPITKVGRKYGYVTRYSREEPFELETGHSHHSEPNTRINGWGFDVYESEQQYLQSQFEASEYARLQKRMSPQSYYFVSLPPDAVEKIHKILDEVLDLSE